MDWGGSESVTIAQNTCWPSCTIASITIGVRYLQFPIYIHVGRYSLDPHLVLEAAAYFLGFRVFQLLKYRQGDFVSRQNRWSVIAAAALGGALGSKFLYWLEDPIQTLHRWRDVNYMMGGKTIVGGLVGGLIAVELVKRLVGEERRTGDLFAVALCVGIAIGRIGCFLEGLPDQTFGIQTSLPWAVDFGDGVSRHPVQLYECLFAIVLAVFLLRFQKHQQLPGDTFKLFMVAYLFFRLLVDFIKPGVPIIGLTAIQWTCVFVLFYYSADIRRWLRPQAAMEAA